MTKIAVACGVLFNVALVGAGTWDYARQAEAAGLSFSEYGLDAWASSFSIRGEVAAHQEIAARPPVILGPDMSAQNIAPQVRAEVLIDPDIALNQFLPGDRGGWFRSAWTAAHDFVFTGSTENFTSDQIKALARPGELSASQQFLRLDRLNPAESRPEQSPHRAVYQRGGWAIAVNIRVLRDPTAKSGAASLRDPSGVSGLIQSVHSGVAFQDVSRDGAYANGVRVLRGLVGRELEIEVITNADDRALHFMLAGIDYNGLNRALRDRVAGVGRGEGTARHISLTRRMMSDRQKLEYRFEAERRALGRRLSDKIQQARAQNWDSPKVCLDFFGTRYCKSVNA